nr:HNH endonuclease [Romboutsia sp. 1001713B170207_170306_H8]
MNIVTTTSLPPLEKTKDIDVETIYEEGKKKLETHITKERNLKLIPHAKEQFKEKNGHLFCELCGFDFEDFYGEIGKDFIEGHHIKPISDMEKIHFSTTKDIMMLCSNCHEMVHRGIRNNISFDDIKSYIKIKQ